MIQYDNNTLTSTVSDYQWNYGKEVTTLACLSELTSLQMGSECFI